MAKVGRPTKYKKEYCEMLIAHMKSGLSYESFAAVANVCDDTLRQWEKDYKEFSASKKRAFIESRLFWEKIGIAGITGKIKGFNIVGWIFNMKNRFPKEWREKHEIKLENITPFVLESYDGKTKLEMGVRDESKTTEP